MEPSGLGSAAPALKSSELLLSNEFRVLGLGKIRFVPSPPPRQILV